MSPFSDLLFRGGFSVNICSILQADLQLVIRSSSQPNTRIPSISKSDLTVTSPAEAAIIAFYRVGISWNILHTRSCVICPQNRYVAAKFHSWCSSVDDFVAAGETEHVESALATEEQHLLKLNGFTVTHVSKFFE